MVVIVAFFAGRKWKVKVLEVQYANPSIQASNQIESPHNPDRREEKSMHASKLSTPRVFCKRPVSRRRKRRKSRRRIVPVPPKNVLRQHYYRVRVTQTVKSKEPVVQTPNRPDR